MWIVLCNADDVSAYWIYEGLKKHGLKPLELITAELIVHSLRWEYYLKNNGDFVEIELADGRKINSNSISGVLNRLLTLPNRHLQILESADREYAGHEFYAFVLSWINSLSELVLNHSTPQGLSGVWRNSSEWIWLASKADLPTPYYVESSNDLDLKKKNIINEIVIQSELKTIFVIKNYVVGKKAPSNILEGCQRLAKLSNTPLLGIEFIERLDNPWTFYRATPCPDLRKGGRDLVEALMLVLKGK